jgi:DNA processing protein
VLRPLLDQSFHEPELSATIHEISVAQVNPDDRRLRGTLVELLAPSPIAIDDLIRRCEAPAAAMIAVLLDLELAGQVLRHAGNRVSLR